VFATYLWLGAGLLLCWAGAELLVRGAVKLAIGLGVRPLVVGLTVVALGTSAPEAVVSFLAARGPGGDLAVGNVLGSNIANIALVLGALACLRPIQANWVDLRRDLWLLLGVTFGALLLAMTASSVARWEGLLMLGGLVAYFWTSVRVGRSAGGPQAGIVAPRVGPALLIAGVGLLLLLFGAQRFLDAAVELATSFGLPPAAVGATILAVGTSLPEFAASVVAIARGHHEIGIGNLVGSNVVNLLFVMGGVAALRGGGLAVEGDGRTLLLPATMAVTLLLLVLVRVRPRLGRGEGLLLLLLYTLFALRSYDVL